MNYYQITPDITFEDDASLTPSPSNSPTSDEDDDPNWLILTSSKSKPTSSVKQLQKGCSISNKTALDNSVEEKFVKQNENHVYGENCRNNLIDNSAQKLSSSISTLHPSTANKNDNLENGNNAKQTQGVVMRNKRDKSSLSLDLNQESSSKTTSHTSLNNNGSFDDDSHGANCDETVRNSNRFSRILDGVVNYAAGYMSNNNSSKDETEDENTPTLEMISDANDNIFTQSLYGKLHDINVDSGYSDHYSNNYNSFTRTYSSIPREVPPLVLSDLSPEQKPCQEDAITKRIDELFDSLKPSSEELERTDATQCNKKQLQQTSISSSSNNNVVRRRQKHGRASADNNANHRKSLGEGLVGMSTRKLQTMSGYFGDWTKWLKTAEEDVNKESEYHTKLNLGQQSKSLSYEINTNWGEGRYIAGKRGGSSIIMKDSTNSILSKSGSNYAAVVLHDECQNTSSNKKR